MSLHDHPKIRQSQIPGGNLIGVRRWGTPTDWEISGTLWNKLHRTTIMGKRWEKSRFYHHIGKIEWENQWAASVWVELYWCLRRHIPLFMEGNLNYSIPVVPDTKFTDGTISMGCRLKGLTAWPHGDQEMKSHPGLAQNQPEVVAILGYPW